MSGSSISIPANLAGSGDQQPDYSEMNDAGHLLMVHDRDFKNLSSSEKGVAFDHYYGNPPGTFSTLPAEDIEQHAENLKQEGAARGIVPSQSGGSKPAMSPNELPNGYFSWGRNANNPFITPFGTTKSNTKGSDRLKLQVCIRPIQSLEESHLPKFLKDIGHHTYFRVDDPDELLGVGLTDANQVNYHTYGVIGKDGTKNDQEVRKDKLIFRSQQKSGRLKEHWQNSGLPPDECFDVPATPEQRDKIIRGLEYWKGEQCPSCGDKNYQAFHFDDLWEVIRRKPDGFNSNTFTYNMMHKAGVDPGQFVKKSKRFDRVPGYHSTDHQWYPKDIPAGPMLSPNLE